MKVDIEQEMILGGQPFWICR